MFKHFFNFDSKTFFTAFTVFPFLVVFGTLSHEYGHIIMAKILGYETILHYGSMSWFKNGINGEIYASKFDNILVTFAGVLQTITTGTIGFLILKKSKKYFWLGIYLSLFWSREVVNLIMSLTSGIIFNEPLFGGDEVIISEYYNFHKGTFPIILGIIGLYFCFYSILKIKNTKRFSFLLAGFISGITSYIIWFGYLGELILP